MSNIIDTYELATMGQNLSNTFTLASNGILIDVIIEDITPTFPPGGSLGGVPFYEEDEKKKKRITVIATIKGIEYKESIIVDTKPNLSIEDIDIEIKETKDKPIIKVKVKK